MYLLIIREKDNNGTPSEILDAKIVPAKDVDRYARRAAEHNKSNARRSYTIEEHKDDSLVAFLASDRQYDMTKYAALADTIKNELERVEDKLELLRIYYREASSESKLPPAEQTDLHKQSEDPPTFAAYFPAPEDPPCGVVPPKDEMPEDLPDKKRKRKKHRAD